jgi:hypothetical protein
MAAETLVIACGALARELVALIRQNGWQHLDVHCLPPELHNRPERIPGAVLEAIGGRRGTHAQVFVAYADCGTGGLLDKALAPHGIERLPGAHCYELFAGPAVFAELADAEPGTYYLTDFLVRHFDRLVVQALGLDRHPELRDEYFRHYRRVVYLAQTRPGELESLAAAHAARLGLPLEVRFTGLEPMRSALAEHVVQWRS